MSWSSKLLPTICLSLTESEYGALTRAGQEAVSDRATLSDLQEAQEKPTTIHCNNQSAIALTWIDRFHARNRHIDVAYHYIRHLVSSKQVEVSYVPTEDNLADQLTKGLGKERHLMLSRKLGLAAVELTEELQKWVRASNLLVANSQP